MMRRMLILVTILCCAGAAAQQPTPSSRLEVLREAGRATEFAVADAPRAFDFPADHGPHPRFRHEWWYLTGHLEAAGGERFGFELTFFRFALKPDPAAPTEASSAWRTHQIFAAHFAVTDLERRQFHFQERYSRGALGLAGAQSSPLRVWVEDWSLDAPDPDAPWKLRAAAHGYQLRVEARPLSMPVLNGEAGLSRKSRDSGAASYYYSIPRLALRGQLVRDGRSLDVQGIAWLDREWGSGALSASQAGWDWFALQFDDGSALMFYSLRQRDGRQDAASAGTWIGPDGTVRALSSPEVRIEVLDHWTSPRGGRYPAAWRVAIPQLMLRAEVRPLLADQELQTNPRYWEGAVAVTTERAGRTMGGRGYVELVGYAE
jgi:predicted secreted hydrolase